MNAIIIFPEVVLALFHYVSAFIVFTFITGLIGQMLELGYKKTLQYLWYDRTHKIIREHSWRIAPVCNKV